MDKHTAAQDAVDSVRARIQAVRSHGFGSPEALAAHRAAVEAINTAHELGVTDDEFAACLD